MTTGKKKSGILTDKILTALGMFTLPIATALASEFFGVVLFSFFGGLAPPAAAPLVNGLALTVLVYCAVAQSGGHLNPNVTASLMISGHTSLLQGLGYVICQLVGSIVGAGMTKGFSDLADPGCFSAAAGVSHAQLWGWESIMSVLLIVTVYEVAVVQKGASNIGPLVIGLSLVVAAYVGGPATGAALNFARVFGPAVVNGCFDRVWLYFLAHVTAAALGALWGLFVSPVGPYHNALRKKVYSHFQQAVPYSTAPDPLVPFKNGGASTADTSLPPYARYTHERDNLPAVEHHRRSTQPGLP